MSEFSGFVCMSCLCRFPVYILGIYCRKPCVSVNSSILLYFGGLSGIGWLCPTVNILTLKSMNREFKGLLTYRTCPKTHDFRGVPGVTRDHHVLCAFLTFLVV